MDFTRASEPTPEASSAMEKGARVREALAQAVKVMVVNVPPCYYRTSVIRKIAEARMDANSAITHSGEY